MYTSNVAGTVQQLDLAAVAVAKIDGVCGAASGQTFTDVPTASLCTTGTETATSGTGPWSWSCNGSNGGANASCSANIQTYTVTGSGDANGTVSCTSPVNYNTNSVCTITPAAGYHLATLTDDLVDKLASVSGNSYTISNVQANHAVAATFAINTYTVTGSGDANGTVSCTSPVNYNTNSVCTITPAAGYHLATLTDDLVDKLASVSGNSYTISSVQANHTVAATFAINSYTITSAGDANGTISCTTPAAYGANSVCIITPAAGYHLATLTDDLVDKLASVSGNSYTISNVQANHAVAATFAINTYTVNASGDANGTVSCTSPVNYGTNSVCTITPVAGYHLATLTDNSVNKFASVSGSSYTISSVQANHTVAATFAINSYTITSAGDANGTISCTTPAAYGANSVCTITPAAGYHLATLTDDLVDKLASVSGNSYTISNVQANHAVAATFAINTYTVNASGDANGTVSCTSPVNYGTNSVCTITPVAGYHLATLTDNSVNKFASVSGSSYTISSVQANHTVAATFAINSYTITSAGDANGTISCTTPAAYGTNSVCTITPVAGYHLATLTDDLVDKLAFVSANSYTISNVLVNHAVAATFAINSYKVTPSAGTGGSITPVTFQSVSHGATTSFTVTPDAGYSIISVTGCGGTLTGNTYTTGAITGDCSLAATFQINSFAITTTVAGGHGTLSCTTPVNYGSNSTCSITPAANYHLLTFTDNSENKLPSVSANSYTISNVQVHHSVAATFAIDTHTVTTTGGAGSKINPSTPQTINHGSTTSFTITPSLGYGISTVTGCSGSLTGSTYNTGAITANCAVTVTTVLRNGHADGTAQATVTDALNALLSIVGKKTLTPEFNVRYDVAPLNSNGTPQGNGVIDVADVIMLLRRSIGIGNW